MRIALIITELHPGGAEKCFVQLACYLQKHGHEVETWQLWSDPPAAKLALVEQLRAADIACHSLGIDRAWEFPGGLWKLRRQLKEFAPDVIQSFLFHANVATGLAGFRIAPMIGGIRVRQPQRWRSRLQRWVSRRMEKLVCVSDSVLKHTALAEDIPANKLLVIPNGIDLTQLPDALTDWSQLGLPSENTPVILFVGRLDEQKGILDFLRNADCLLRELPEHHLVLMGSGPQEQQVTQLSQASDRIHVAGYRADAMRWMQSARILVLPAKYEGMPNVILEAMACETAVVAFEVEGVRELLGHSELGNAQVAEQGQFDELTQKIIAICTSDDLHQKCARFNRERIEESFRIEDQFEKYLALYRSVSKSS